MARQITDLEEIFSNQLADQDYLLVRDTSSRVDKKVTVEALRSAFLSVLGDISTMDTLDGGLIEDNSVGIEKVNFVKTYHNQQHVLTVGDIQIVTGTSSVASGGTAVTFVKPFAEIPNVVCTIKDTNNQTAWCSSVSSTSATMKQIYTGASLWVSWVAIGKRGTW